MVKPQRISPVQEFLRASTTQRSKKSTNKAAVERQPRLYDEVLAPSGGMAGENDWLRVLLDEALERDQLLWQPPADSFHGSGSGNPCVRALTFKALGHNVPFEARVLRIFGTGKAIELVIVEAACKAKVLVEKSDQLEGKVLHPERGIPLITCHVDMLVKRPSDSQKFLAEIKSINEYGFDALPKEHGLTLAGKSPLLEKYRGYVVQWNTYAFAPEINLVEGCLLFEAKNTQRQKYYWLRRDQDLHEAMLARHVEAAEYAIYAEPRQLAPVPEGFDPQQDRGACSKCDHRYLCKRLPVGAVKYDDVRAEDAKLRG